MAHIITGELDFTSKKTRVSMFATLSLPVAMSVLGVVMHLFPALPVFIPVVLYTLVFVAMLLFTVYDFFHIVAHDMSYALICPLSLSIFMNLFLSGVVHGISNGIASVLLSSNILYCFVVVAVVAVFQCLQGEIGGISKRVGVLLCVLLGYAVALFVIFPAPITSFASTLRNLITPFCFLLLGAVLSERLSLDSLCDMVILLGLVVVVFGLFERFVFPNFWVEANIQDLWGLKGITVYDHRPPNNFYSSELFGGLQTRRMASLFADPVHLGTFLFGMFAAAWYRKRWFMVGLAVASCVLTISKGALLGFLVWIFIYCLITSDNVWVKRGSLAFVVTVALGFLAFTAVNSTGSAAAHMRGALGGLFSIVENPFGYGCGNVGVLASLANKGAMRGVEESGFGVIAGEVGVVGVAMYVAMFVFALKESISLADKRMKILALTLLLSIFANIMFNEVALSPNSCGIFFSLMGAMLATGGDTGRSAYVGAHFAPKAR